MSYLSSCLSFWPWSQRPELPFATRETTPFFPPSALATISSAAGSVRKDLESGATSPIPVLSPLEAQTIIENTASLIQAQIAAEQALGFDRGRVIANLRTHAMSLRNFLTPFVLTQLFITLGWLAAPSTDKESQAYFAGNMIAGIFVMLCSTAYNHNATENDRAARGEKLPGNEREAKKRFHALTAPKISKAASQVLAFTGASSQALLTVFTPTLFIEPGTPAMYMISSAIFAAYWGPSEPRSLEALRFFSRGCHSEINSDFYFEDEEDDAEDNSKYPLSAAVSIGLGALGVAACFLYAYGVGVFFLHLPELFGAAPLTLAPWEEFWAAVAIGLLPNAAQIGVTLEELFKSFGWPTCDYDCEDYRLPIDILILLLTVITTCLPIAVLGCANLFNHGMGSSVPGIVGIAFLGALTLASISSRAYPLYRLAQRKWGEILRDSVWPINTGSLAFQCGTILLDRTIPEWEKRYKKPQEARSGGNPQAIEKARKYLKQAKADVEKCLTTFLCGVLTDIVRKNRNLSTEDQKRYERSIWGKTEIVEINTTTGTKQVNLKTEIRILMNYLFRNNLPIDQSIAAIKQLLGVSLTTTVAASADSDSTSATAPLIGVPRADYGTLAAPEIIAAAPSPQGTLGLIGAHSNSAPPAPTKADQAAGVAANARNQATAFASTAFTAGDAYAGAIAPLSRTAH